jgi:hypothetical protein
MNAEEQWWTEVIVRKFSPLALPYSLIATSAQLHLILLLLLCVTWHIVIFSYVTAIFSFSKF